MHNKIENSEINLNLDVIILPGLNTKLDDLILPDRFLNLVKRLKKITQFHARFKLGETFGDLISLSSSEISKLPGIGLSYLKVFDELKLLTQSIDMDLCENNNEDSYISDRFLEQIIEKELDDFLLPERFSKLIKRLRNISLNNKKFKPEFLININEILETFTIRVFIFGNKKGNTGNSALFDLAHKVYTNKINFTELKKELKSLIEKNSNNLDFKKSIINISAYNTINISALKLILLDYEYHLQNETLSKFDIGTINELVKNQKITIEHIAPQNILPGVKLMENINLLGNLVLTCNNSNLSNKTFQSKKAFYLKYDLASERELIDFEEWNDKTIIERGKKIQKFIIEKWKP